MFNLIEIRMQLASLVVFRRILRDPVMESLRTLLMMKPESPEEIASAFAGFAHLLLETGGNLGRHIERLILADENAYMRLRIKGGKIPDAIEQLVERELQVLEQIAATDLAGLASALGCTWDLPTWESSSSGLAQRYRKTMSEIATHGYGIFAEHTMFTFDADGLQLVRTPDPIRLSGLYGYERERGEVISNVLAFLDGKPAENMLLYGDAGTGKSSTVKAIANEYACRGLRLVEVRHDALGLLHKLTAILAENPLKFLLFIDDLSLDEKDSQLAPLKAALEGSACSRADNILVCATSNRRRLVRQSFSEREGDDVNRVETIEEKISLSERFGLAVGFFKPDRISYASIVRAIAESRGIEFTPELERGAEQHAQRHGGRSGRAARQFIDSITDR
jgi:predicted AAA+ superfamily ATPase